MKLAIVVSYHVNKEYITANFCENKAKPQMKCNGKCYLAKKIQAEEKQEQQLPSILKRIGDVTLFFSTQHFSFLHAMPSGLTAVTNSFYLLKTYSSPLDCIFQPPQ